MKTFSFQNSSDNVIEFIHFKQRKQDQRSLRADLRYFEVIRRLDARQL